VQTSLPNVPPVCPSAQGSPADASLELRFGSGTPSTLASLLRFQNCHWFLHLPWLIINLILFLQTHHHLTPVHLALFGPPLVTLPKNQVRVTGLLSDSFLARPT
jgi:hypothetical protein